MDCHSVDGVTQWTASLSGWCLSGLWCLGSVGCRTERVYGAECLLLFLFVFDVMHVSENTPVVQNIETASILTQDLKGARG